MAEGADNLDHVSDAEEFFRLAAIRYASFTEEAPRDFDGESCYDCGADIPGARLKLGKFTCVACQTKREKRGKLMGR